MLLTQIMTVRWHIGLHDVTAPCARCSFGWDPSISDTAGNPIPAREEIALYPGGLTGALGDDPLSMKHATTDDCP